MTSIFLNRKQNPELILFFNGWGMDHTRFETWSSGDYDVLVLHDFANLEALPELSAYSRIHLVAWSLGVWVASHLLAQATFSKRLATRLAINGTLIPIDATYGIAPEIFDGTIENWHDLQAREKFGLRVSGTTETLSQRSPESQYDELVVMRRMISALPPPENIYTTAVIGMRDRIFPPVAQRRFWERHSSVTVLEKVMLHDPFMRIHSWEEVLALAKT